VATLKEQLDACLSQSFNAVDVAISTEGWASILPRLEGEELYWPGHEEEVCAMVGLDQEVAHGMVEYITAVTRTDRPKLLLPQDYDLLAFDGDDVAMVLRFAGTAVDRNPIVSFWCFATLLSVTDENYQEATIYWLSAAAAIVALSRRRADFVRRAYLKVLIEAARTDGPNSHVWLPIYEILLESVSGIHSRLPDAYRDGVEEVSKLLAERLYNAVEHDRVEIARGAFSILWPSAERHGLKLPPQPRQP
jgi:hypothetical protein